MTRAITAIFILTLGIFISPASLFASSGTLIITEVHPSGSGNGTYAADWFEVTNLSQTPVNITGWKVDDSSNAFASAVALRGVTSIPAGQSVIFFEGTDSGSTDATILAAFSNAWFGTVTPPAGTLIGAYGGSGIGLSGSGDAVNLFDAAGTLVTGVSFGAATASATFDNAAGAGSRTLPLPAITTLSVVGVGGASLSANGSETGSPGRIIAGIDLSKYVRIGRYDLPEPTRSPKPAGSLLAQEVSAVTYNWDTNTLFVVGDGGTSVVQVTKTGQLVDSMTLAAGSSPQGTEFYDPEGLTYIGNGTFVMSEERDRRIVRFTYAAGTTLTRAATQSVVIGTFVPNIGVEGISFDPQTGGYIAVEEIEPLQVFLTQLNFAAGTSSNGVPGVEPTNLFNPAPLGLLDFADVFAVSNLPTLIGHPQFQDLLLLSQESGKIVHVNRTGAVLNSLTIQSDAGNPLDIASQQHEGLTMDGTGFLYIVSENGGGDFDHPQLWVYAPAAAANLAPTAVTLTNGVTAILETANTAAPTKVADIVVTDDGLGTNALTVGGADATSFEIAGSALHLKAGVVLNYEQKNSYSVTVSVDDAALGGTPDATSAVFTLNVTDVVNENPSASSIVFSEVAPWSSGNSAIGADWFEVTNLGTVAIPLTGWKVDDSSASVAAALPLNGITSIAPGESVIFIETADPAAMAATFRSNWFGASPPAGLQIGSYTGNGAGLSTGGDGLNLYDGNGVLQANVSFGVSPAGPYPTFDNAAGLNSATITRMSKVGTHGAFAAAANAAEIGSPGNVGRIIISEVAPWSSGDSPVAADWFELTNGSARVIDLTGWTMDDSSGSPAAAVPMSGVASIAPGESVIFLESSDLPTVAAAFRENWFGAHSPSRPQIGSYSGSGVGLSTGGDAVHVYNADGVLQAFVTFGASPGNAPFATFDNASAVHKAAISQLSVAGVNGAFVTRSDDEVGSPGRTQDGRRRAARH